MSIRLVCARRLADSYEMDAIIHFRFVYICTQILLVDCDLNAVLGACTLNYSSEEDSQELSRFLVRNMYLVSLCECGTVFFFFSHG